MKTYLDCIPCFLQQALEAAKLSGAHGRAQKRIIDAVAVSIPRFSLRSSPPEMARVIHGIVKKIAARDDPYRAIKRKSNRLALKAYPRLKGKISQAPDKLLAAVELAIAGNIIDYGVKNSLNVEKELDKILDEENEAIRQESKSIFNYKAFKRALQRAKTILYLADNAGEVVFDRVLLEEIKGRHKDKNILYAVKEKPIINDALAADARSAGIQKYATIISSGVDTPGTVLSLCSKKFLKIFRRADMIISKGQGNFEALSDSCRPIYFLFMAKCPVVAAAVKGKVGDIVLLYQKKRLQ